MKRRKDELDERLRIEQDRLLRQERTIRQVLLSISVLYFNGEYFTLVQSTLERCNIFVLHICLSLEWLVRSLYAPTGCVAAVITCATPAHSTFRTGCNALHHHRCLTTRYIRPDRKYVSSNKAYSHIFLTSSEGKFAFSCGSYIT